MGGGIGNWVGVDGDAFLTLKELRLRAKKDQTRNGLDRAGACLTTCEIWFTIKMGSAVIKQCSHLMLSFMSILLSDGCSSPNCYHNSGIICNCIWMFQSLRKMLQDPIWIRHWCQRFSFVFCSLFFLVLFFLKKVLLIVNFLLMKGITVMDVYAEGHNLWHFQLGYD